MIKKNDGQSYLKKFPAVMKENNSMSFLKKYSQRILLNQHNVVKKGQQSQKQKENISANNNIIQKNDNKRKMKANVKGKQLRSLTQRMQDIMEELYLDNKVLKQKCQPSFQQQQGDTLNLKQNTQNNSCRVWVHKRRHTLCDSEDSINKLRQLTQRSQLKRSNYKQKANNHDQINNKKSENSALKAEICNQKMAVNGLIDKVKQAIQIDIRNYCEQYQQMIAFQISDLKDLGKTQSRESQWNNSLGVNFTTSQLVQNTKQDSQKYLMSSNNLQIDLMKQQLEQKNRRIIQLEFLLLQRQRVETEPQLRKDQKRDICQFKACGQDDSHSLLQESLLIIEENQISLFDADSLDYLKQDMHAQKLLQQQIEIIHCQSQQELEACQRVRVQYQFCQQACFEQLFIISQESLPKSQANANLNFANFTIQNQIGNISFKKIPRKDQLCCQQTLNNITVFPTNKSLQQIQVQTTELKQLWTQANEAQKEDTKQVKTYEQFCVQTENVILPNLQLSQSIKSDKLMVDANVGIQDIQKIQKSVSCQKIEVANRYTQTACFELNQYATNTSLVDKISVQVQVNCDLFQQTYFSYYTCAYD